MFPDFFYVSAFSRLLYSEEIVQDKTPDSQCLGIKHTGGVFCAAAVQIELLLVSVQNPGVIFSLCSYFKYLFGIVGCVEDQIVQSDIYTIEFRKTSSSDLLPV